MKAVEDTEPETTTEGKAAKTAAAKKAPAARKATPRPTAAKTASSKGTAKTAAKGPAKKADPELTAELNGLAAATPGSSADLVEPSPEEVGELPPSWRPS